jgi:S-DNA-T family DNA segregation ATPase FtsK/SpoIIIE
MQALSSPADTTADTTDDASPAPVAAIRLPSAPSPPSRPGFPLLACVAPLIAAGLIWWLTGSAFVLIFAVLSPVIAVAGLLDGRRTMTRQRRRETAEYAAAMTETREAVDARLRHLRTEAWRAAASPHRMLETASDPHRWADSAAVPVVLGAGATPSGLRLDGGRGRAEHTELQAHAAVLTGSPIIVDPADGIGLVGPSLVARAVARSVVVQLTGRLSPRALGVRVPPGATWDWARQLPHAGPGTPGRWLTVTETPDAVPATTGDDIRLALADTGARLPPGLATVVTVRDSAQACLVRAAGHPPGLGFAPLMVAERQTDGYGARLTAEAAAAGLGATGDELPAPRTEQPAAAGQTA